MRGGVFERNIFRYYYTISGQTQTSQMGPDNYGNYTKLWLARFFADMKLNDNIFQQIERFKVIAILKHGKSADNPQNYWPITQMPVIYKLL